MGSLFKPKTGSISDPGAEQAWNIAKPTQQYLNSAGMEFTQGLMENPAYSGQRVAGLNGYQTGGANNLGNYALGNSGMAQFATGLSGGLAASGAGFGQNAQQMFAQGGMDPTQSIINSAGQYANNPYVSGMIDSANRDTQRMLTEQQLPSLARSFAGTGNTNSSRAGVEQAIAERGAADRMNDTAANIRSSLFGQGLGMAQNQWNQNFANQLNANGQLMNAYQTGLGGLQTGQDLASGYFGQSQAAGGLYQGQNQAELDANKSYFDEAMANRMGALQGLSGIAANTQAKTSAGTYQGPSTAAQVGSFMSAMKPKGF